MGDLFYNQLGGVAGYPITEVYTGVYNNLFTNIQNYVYWSGSEVAPSPGDAWYFITNNNVQANGGKYGQYYALAVRLGDVAAVPVPGAFWLFGSALVGLMGLKRRSNIG